MIMSWECPPQDWELSFLYESALIFWGASASFACQANFTLDLKKSNPIDYNCFMITPGELPGYIKKSPGREPLP